MYFSNNSFMVLKLQSGPAESFHEQLDRIEPDITGDTVEFEDRIKDLLAVHERSTSVLHGINTVLQNEGAKEASVKALLQRLHSNNPNATAEIEEKMKQSADRRIERQKTQIYTPFIHIHRAVMAKLIGDKSEKTTVGDFEYLAECVMFLGSQGPEMAWVAKQYSNELKQVIRSENEQDYGQAMEALVSAIASHPSAGTEQMPDALKYMPSREVLREFLSSTQIGVLSMQDRSQLGNVAKAVVPGLFGHMPNNLDGMTNDHEQLKQLDEAKTSSLRVVIDYHVIEAYGVDALLAKIAPYKGKQILMVHQKKDSEVGHMLEFLNEGDTVTTTMRNTNETVVFEGLETDLVRMLDNKAAPAGCPDMKELCAHPLKYINPDFKVSFASKHGKANGTPKP